MDPDLTAKEFKAELTEIDRATDRLRATFEQYFQGIERRPPITEQTELKRRILRLRTTPVRNTELRFRINQMVAKFNTYETYWTRVLRQIEEGTYHRDLFKARFRSKSDQPPPESPPGSEAPDPSPGSGAPDSPPRKEKESGLSDENVNAIYNAFMAAKRRCNQNTNNLTRETLAKSLGKQIPSIKKQYKCKSIEFKVMIKAGKAVLKAVPKF